MQDVKPDTPAIADAVAMTASRAAVNAISLISISMYDAEPDSAHSV